MLYFLGGTLPAAPAALPRTLLAPPLAVADFGVCTGDLVGGATLLAPRAAPAPPRATPPPLVAGVEAGLVGAGNAFFAVLEGKGFLPPTGVPPAGPFFAPTGTPLLGFFDAAGGKAPLGALYVGALFMPYWREAD